MKLKRRNFLLFLTGSAGVFTLGSLSAQAKKHSMPFSKQTPLPQTELKQTIPFKAIKGPIPLPTSDIAPKQQIKQYSKYEVVDDLLLPPGFSYEVIAVWGDKVGDSRFGYNNDYLSFVENGENQGYLSVNFEYISAYPWMQTYQQVIGKSLPFKEVQERIKLTATKKSQINAYALAELDPIKAQIREICKEALLDQGIGVISIRQTANRKWVRTNSAADRRISGISGLEDGRYLKVTGPAAAVFRKQQGLGYIDRLGDRIIGSFGNCAGGTTNWGTVLSAEENFQNQVPEAVYADGTASLPGELPFSLDDGKLLGQGNVFGLAGNKYGWIVEVDPALANDYGTKHTWLGRYRHEAVGVRVEAGKQLAFYSGCDRTGGHIYKFISSDRVRDPKSKANSRLLQNGMLYAAKFNPDGTGRWIPLQANTPINPDSPDHIVGNLLKLPTGTNANSYLTAKTEAQIKQFKQQYKNLGDLYLGNAEEKQGAILIDAHYAANAVGATSTARPEDTEIAPDGSLYISFTSGVTGKEGGPDKRIFTGLKGETPYEHGWVMQLIEDRNQPAALTFRWEILAMGGEPASGGVGFSNPDNLLIDRNGNLWVVTDTSSNDVFGNNSIWYIPTQGANAGKAYLFGIGPMECETTGPCFTTDEQTMFLSIQHPGEGNGIRQSNILETRKVTITTTNGEQFQQIRSFPVGSNWPSKKVNSPPLPGVVAIQRHSQSV